MQEDLYQWVRLQPVLELVPGSSLILEPLNGDAGFRRYYRLLNSKKPMLSVIAPPATEKNTEFVSIAYLLKAHGLRAPEIYAVNFSKGFLLIEDLGQQQFLDFLSAHTVDGYYRQAFDVLLTMQGVNCEDEALPPYTPDLLKQEMQLFQHWFVEKLLGVRMTAGETRNLEALFSILVDSACEQPQVFVHRDFHSRNLLCHLNNPGVIDFQDAVVGPFTYDLVSLLRDCYVYWSPLKLEKWLATFYSDTVVKASINPGTYPQFLRWFDLMGLQRHLKVLGIFARLSLRDEKHDYLDDLPLVLHYVLSVAAKYPEEFGHFIHFVESRLMPLITPSPWFKPFDVLHAGEGWKRT